jgi:site-specific recombinase XerD
MIAEHRNILAQTRKGSTVHRYLAVLSHAFSMAVKAYQWLDDNPCGKIRKPPEPRGRVRFLSEEESRRLLAGSAAYAVAEA